MIGGLLKVSGMLILKLVYGKKFEEKASEKFILMIFLSLINIVWLFAFMLFVSGTAANDTVTCAILTFAYPIIIAVWAVIERKKQA